MYIPFGHFGRISNDRNSSQWQWSIHLLRQLQRLQLQANVVAYNAAIDACQDDFATT